jgi:hypothetical protein
VTSDFDEQGIALTGRCGRHEGSADPIESPTIVQHAVAGQDALDQYFAQTADDAEQDKGEELIIQLLPFRCYQDSAWSFCLRPGRDCDFLQDASVGREEAVLVG